MTASWLCQCYFCTRHRTTPAKPWIPGWRANAAGLPQLFEVVLQSGNRMAQEKPASVDARAMARSRIPAAMADLRQATEVRDLLGYSGYPAFSIY